MYSGGQTTTIVNNQFGARIHQFMGFMVPPSHANGPNAGIFRHRHVIGRIANHNRLRGVDTGFFQGFINHVGFRFAGRAIGCLKRREFFQEIVTTQGCDKPTMRFARRHAKQPTGLFQIVKAGRRSGIKRFRNFATRAGRREGALISPFKFETQFVGRPGKQYGDRLEKRKTNDSKHRARMRLRQAMEIRGFRHGRNNGVPAIDQGSVAIKNRETQAQEWIPKFKPSRCFRAKTFCAPSQAREQFRA